MIMLTLAERERLFAANEKLAFSACTHWVRTNKGFVERYNLQRDDLDSVALAALWMATEKWNPSRGAFSTIATLAVHSRLKHVLRHHSTAKRGFGEHEPESLDARLPGADSLTLGDTLRAPLSESPERAVLGAIINPVLWQAVEKLPRGQAEVIRLRFVEGLSVQETAARMGVKYNNVSALANSGIKKLRAACQHLDLWV